MVLSEILSATCDVKVREMFSESEKMLDFWGTYVCLTIRFINIGLTIRFHRAFFK